MYRILMGAAAGALSSLIQTSAFAAQDCAALANLKIDDTNLLSAADVPASGDLPGLLSRAGLRSSGHRF